MNVMRLHGKFGDNEGIVFMRNKHVSSTWQVKLDINEPDNLNKAKLVCQIK